MERKEMNIPVSFIFGLDKILDHLAENDLYLAQIGETTIRYHGTLQDTGGGKREVFEIIRKVK